MSDLESFRQELTARVKAAAAAPSWPMPEFNRYMEALQPRRQQFQETARSMMSGVIRPRVEALLALFPSARLIESDKADRCCCWFAASDRFPITAKIEFAIEHDEAVERIYVCYEAALIPLFVAFQPHDRLTMPLERADLQLAAQWVEKRIFEFLESYLRHDRGAEDLDEDVVTDPVCGMRLSRSEAKEHSEYRGHPYFFCSSECRQQFDADPARHVKVRSF